MKIVYVVTTFPWSKGKEDFFLPEIVELTESGHELIIVPRAPSGEITNEASTAILPRVNAQPLVSGAILKHCLGEILSRPMAVLRTFLMLLPGSRLSTSMKNLAVFPKGVWLGRIVRSSGAEHIHAQWATTTSTIAMVASEISGVPWSFTAHRGDIVNNNVFALKARKASFVRFISQSGMKLAEDLTGTAENRKFKVIHMGVRLPSVSSEDPGVADVNLVCPANLIPVKGHSYLLHALRILQEKGVKCQLHIVGDGPLGDALANEAAAIGIAGMVKFHGFIPHSKLLEMYVTKFASIVVLPSLDLGNGLHEGIPVSLMEAMSYGIPVVSTKTGGIPELISDDAGILVDQKDPMALAEAIEALIDYPSTRNRFIDAAFKRVDRDFNIVSSTEKLVELMVLPPTAKGSKAK